MKKICSKCNEEKLFVDFHKNRNGKNGLKSTCKKCDAIQDRKRLDRLSQRSGIVTPQTKRCSPCGETKAADRFGKNKIQKDGLQYCCKKCQSFFETSRRKSLLSTNPRRLKLQNMLYCAKNRARKHGLPFDLDFTWMIETFGQLMKCPILGLEIDWASTQQQTNESPSLDRIIPERGYTKGNVQIVCHLANMMKSNSTYEQRVAFAIYVLKIECQNAPSLI